MTSPERSRFLIATSWGEAAVPRHFAALASELVRRGHEAGLLVDRLRRDVENPNGAPAVWTWPSARPTKLRDARFLARLIRERHPHCLVANFGAVNLMMLVGRALDVPARISWYHTIERQTRLDSAEPRLIAWLKRHRKRMAYAAATHVAAVSAAAADDATRTFGIPPRKCRIFPNAIADPLADGRTRLVDPRDSRLVVCVGRLHRSKGQDIVIRAMPLLRRVVPEVVVEFIGDGPRRAEYEALALELGVTDRCRFVGRLPPSQVIARMASAAVTVAASRAEAFGLVNVESLAVGTPIVAAGVGGIPEIVRDGIDGFLTPVDEPAALADRLAMLLRDTRLRDRMSRDARARFLQCFEQRRAVAEQATWLEAVAAGSDR